MKQVLIFYFLLSYFGSTAQGEYPYLYKSASFEGTLFEKSENRYVRYGATNPKVQDIDMAEKWISTKIDSIVQAFNFESKVDVAITSKFKQYRRQYFAYFNHKKEKVIIISFIQSSVLHDDTWQRHPILLSDGWDNYWRISFNTKTKRFSDFYVNSLGG